MARSLALPELCACRLILYAMSWPERLPTGGSGLISGDERANFEQPDNDRFPGPPAGADALAAGGSMSAVLNGANEVVVDAFLHEKILSAIIARLCGGDAMQAVLRIAHPTRSSRCSSATAARQKAAALPGAFGA